MENGYSSERPLLNVPDTATAEDREKAELLNEMYTLYSLEEIRAILNFIKLKYLKFSTQS